MKFSVIVPIYKVEKYLSECIESILNQKYEDYELILVDDGSPDRCPEICDSFAKSNQKVKVIHKKNGGLSSARNEGLKIADGEYVVYLDSDDFFIDNQCLQRIADKTCSGPDIIMYKTASCNEDGDNLVYPAMVMDYSSRDCSMADMLNKTIGGEEFQASAWSKSIKRTLLVDNQIAFTEGLLGEDIDWYLDVIRHAKSFEMVNEYIYVYRSRPGSITKTTKIKNLTDLLWILEKWTKKMGNSETDRALMGYLGKTYTSLLIMYAGINKDERRAYKADVKKYFYLLGFDTYPRTRTIRNFYRLVGFDGVILLLGVAREIRKYRK